VGDRHESWLTRHCSNCPSRRLTIRYPSERDRSAAWEAPTTDARHQRYLPDPLVTVCIEGPLNSAMDRQFRSERGLIVVSNRVPVVQMLRTTARPSMAAQLSGIDLCELPGNDPLASIVLPI
jgi:hypothetical protein